MAGGADRPHVGRSLTKSSPGVGESESALMELCSQSSVALEKVSERLKHVAMSLLSPQGSVDSQRSSSSYDRRSGSSERLHQTPYFVRLGPLRDRSESGGGDLSCPDDVQCA